MDTTHAFYYHGPPEIARFIEGVAAAQKCLNRGYETQSALECIVLSAAIVDALLRLGIIMRQQLDRNSNEVDESLLHQSNEDKIIAERWVIDEAERRGVVMSTLASQLRKLYAMRNKCIHRYIISDINYDYATKLVFDYSDTINTLGVAIGALEREQRERGVGIVAAKADTAEPCYESGIKQWFHELAIAKERRGNNDG